MAESAEQVHARLTAAAEANGGHLPMPPQGGWDIFPWVAVDGAVAPRPLPAPADEAPRSGEGGRPCELCTDGFPPERVVWEDDYWVLLRPPAPTGLPVLLNLCPREHLDFGQLDDDRASEFGRIANRLARIVEGLDNVARCQVLKYGDGGSHMHAFFAGRTARLSHVLGSPVIDWDEIIPPGPEDVWLADLHTIATKLANWGGAARI
ncbi:hypothetical protein [Nocardioides sp. SYSU D00038]|uniref:hypothetical protein n=1 Tax=Nocardioides sp. SYSU D00038 TaxID=2812554 RepID=UPI00196897E6|nr:hypothetical protein [Nocardioides sp. SYSU D00038]